MISAIVVVPTISPEGPRLTGVPIIVTAGPSGNTVRLPMANPVGLAVNT